jgi:hypothetical protein
MRAIAKLSAHSACTKLIRRTGYIQYFKDLGGSLASLVQGPVRMLLSSSIPLRQNLSKVTMLAHRTTSVLVGKLLLS